MEIYSGFVVSFTKPAIDVSFKSIDMLSVYGLGTSNMKEIKIAHYGREKDLLL